MKNELLTYYKEKFRPQYHFSPEKNFTNDPCGLVYFRGEYHLFYQYNPFDLDQDPNILYWGHAISTDLVHWRHMPIALGPDELGGISTGCGVVDWNNTSGLFRDEPGIVLVFVYVRFDEWEAPAIAFSNDRGRTWQKLTSRNPILDPGSPGQLKDAKVFWHKDTGRWIMLLTSSALQLFSSVNLIDWKFESEIQNVRSECPDLFELNVDNNSNDTRWVLSLAGRSYHIGTFDGHEFKAQTEPIQMNYGPDAYASQSWSDVPNSRRVMIDWMMSWKYARRLDLIPTRPWNGSMSFPKELTLRETEDGVRLYQLPVKEISNLRKKYHCHEDIDIEPGKPFSPQLNGTCIELQAEFEIKSAISFGLEVMRSNRTKYVFNHRSHDIAGEKTTIEYNVEQEKLIVDRSTSGTVYSEDFPQSFSAPLKLMGKIIKLKLLIDWSSLETFANDGEVVLSTLIFPTPFGGDIRVFSKKGTIRLKKLEIFKLDSIWNLSQ